MKDNIISVEQGYKNELSVSTQCTDSAILISPFRPFVWKFIILGGVLLYSSFGILVQLSKVNNDIPFNSLSIVFFTEILKLFLSINFYLINVLNKRKDSNKQLGNVFGYVYKSVCSEFTQEGSPPSWLNFFCILLPFTVPALIYTINNNLGYLLLMEMDPATYHVLGNLKILSTALLFRIIMKRPISGIQWLSLSLLVIAGMINGLANSHKDSDVSAAVIHISFKGLILMGILCTLSGLAGVYTEYVLKKRVKMSLNIQNACLYLFGSALNALFFTANMSRLKDKFDPFKGFNWIAILLIITQACIGLLFGCIMKYANNILRLFVISSSVVLTTLFSILLFGLVLNFSFLCSASLVIIAIILYQC